MSDSSSRVSALTIWYSSSTPRVGISIFWCGPPPHHHEVSASADARGQSGITITGVCPPPDVTLLIEPGGETGEHPVHVAEVEVGVEVHGHLHGLRAPARTPGRSPRSARRAPGRPSIPSRRRGARARTHCDRSPSRAPLPCRRTRRDGLRTKRSRFSRTNGRRSTVFPRRTVLRLAHLAGPRHVRVDHLALLGGHPAVVAVAREQRERDLLVHELAAERVDHHDGAVAVGATRAPGARFSRSRNSLASTRR